MSSSRRAHLEWVASGRHVSCLFIVFAAGPFGVGSLWVSRVMDFLLSPFSLISSKSQWIKSARASSSTLQSSGHPGTTDAIRRSALYLSGYFTPVWSSSFAGCTTPDSLLLRLSYRVDSHLLPRSALLLRGSISIESSKYF